MQNTLEFKSQPSAVSFFDGKIQRAYRAFRNRLSLSTADRLFVNAAQYLQARTQSGEGRVVLQMRRGLYFTVRRNLWDAESISEVFARPAFLQRLGLGRRATVVEVGGYIGSFSIYAVKALRAARVVTYEPNTSNFELLSQNVENNTLAHRITPVNDAVTSLEAVLSKNALTQVDLLKVNSAEQMDWLTEAPQALLQQVKNIVLRLPAEENQAMVPVLLHLQDSGYSVRTEQGFAYAALKA